MRIALAQLNPIVGDIAGNTALVLNAIELARRDSADILVTSELVLVGYPPRDLLFREGVVDACEHAVQRIAQHAGDMHVIVGHPRRAAPNASRPFRNSASVCHNGKVIAECDKQLLPGYDVFDEDRYFEPGARTLVVPINNHHVGLLICEDLWRAKDVNALRQYAVEPVAECMAQREGGCDLILSLNASPFVIGKWQKHVEQMKDIATDYHVPVIAVNQVGGNDDLIFDGRSVIVAHDGSLAHVLPGYESAVQTIELEAQGLESMGVASKGTLDDWRHAEREVFHALVLGVRDYVHKTGNKKVLIGLSGGIDSALVAVIASAALGSENVHGVMMPSIYSSSGSVADSLDLAKRLNLASCREISIKQIHDAMRHTLMPALHEKCEGVTDENIQARLRGVILMALSNASGALLLSTSNKSEVATGYSTLYGDMCGALAVVGDLLKTRIYALSRWINANHAACGFVQPPIPENSLTKPPSAELRPNQTDQDTLPPYEILDQIIERFIEREESEETIISETGFDLALVRKTLNMVDRAQYKRDQAPVILKLTYRAFGRGRPMPIVMKANVQLTNEQRPTKIEPAAASRASASPRPVSAINRQS